MAIKKILHIVGRMDRAGAETMLMNIYRKLDKKKYQFNFLYFTNDKCDYDDEIISLGGRIHRLSNIKTITRGISIYKFLKQNQSYHAIHTHMLLSSGINLMVSYIAGYKNRIVHAHSTNNSRAESFLGKIYLILSRKLINLFGTKFIACGQEAGNFLFPGNNNVIQLPNAIDVNYFNTCGIKYKSYLRDTLNIDKSKIILCQIGRLSPVKNHKFSIQLAVKLKDKNINFHMVFAGDGNLKESLIEYSKEKGVFENISFLGIREDIPKILAGSDIMLMPSHHEGFPVVLVESQSVGVLSIVSNNVSKEVDLDVGKVLFRPLDDIDSWSHIITTNKNKPFMDQENRVSIISNKGFDINKSISIIENIYS